MEDTTFILICAMLFIGLPWTVFHYVTKWKTAPKITQEDEKLLDEMHLLARRLEDRLTTVERIVAADNPDWKPGLDAPRPEWKPGPSAPQQTDRPTYQIDRRN